VEPRTLVAGVPARPLRRVSGEEAEKIERDLERLLEKAAEYRRALLGEE